jgi:5-enolpyruvylshikimate-3-phosphate synthase
MQKEDRTNIANAEKLAGMAKDIEYIKIAMDDLKKFIAEFKENYVTKEEFGGLEHRVAKIESDLSWAVRLIVGAVITAVSALVLITR